MDILSLRSGSRGNASLVSGGNTKLLVDCGVSGKSVTSALADVDVYPEDISAIAVTHEHIDHIAGIGVMMRRYHIPVWANAATWTAMESQVGKIDKSLVNIFDNDSSFEIGEIGVKPFSIPHDAADPVGYSFMCGDEKVAVATDIGELKKDLFEAIRGSKTVLLESNHDVNMLEIGKYPPQLKRRIRGKLGHLSNDDAGRAAEFLVRLGTERIILGHLSEENNYPELARQTVICVLNDAGIKCGRDVLLGVALPQQTVSLCG
ncbi:MAG: MBL fold metallo-hydrolase [Eubacteriales bacterium]|nr:MBL fold metallo-hydrolase [Clostridiales bacterium]MDD6915635.1 MBL fold metallo-hydrolase [Eubacteriales bacterium]MDO5586607.1 MBL fold metallo-hydrolase [Clostridia bacterium]MDY4214540.1 MBL fold metallo-hydrolase [Eubacteriales bacterium]